MLFIGAFFLVNSVLYLRDRGRRPPPPGRARFEMERLVGAMTRTTAGKGLVVLAIAGLIAVAGVYLDRRLPVQTDPERFVPADSPVLRDLYRVRDVAGSSSELNFLVEAPDVTDPGLLSWMLEFERKLDARTDVFLRSTSLASLVEQVTGSDDFTPEAVQRTLDVTPDAIRNTVVSDDHRRAAMIFAIGPISLEQRKQVIDEITADLDPPPGVLVRPAGLAVIGVEAVDALSANRDLMSFAALGAIFVLMIIAYRSPVRAVAPILPVMLALGSSAVVLYAFDVELNPLTSVSGPLIIAMGTEFSLLLMARYYEERARGANPREAMELASHRIGRAITASGLTVMGGFGVLAFSGFPLLESFGQVTALNIGLSLLSTLFVLPALLVWADEGLFAKVPEHGAEPVR
jgi:hydrophobe/amphiphile efflux-3 (HAE3) family protein